MSPGKTAIDSDSSLKLVDRFGQKSRFPVGPAKDDMQLRTVAKLFEHPFVDLLRERKLMLLQISKSQGVGDVMIIRRYFQRCLQFSHCLIKIPEHEIALAQHVVRAGTSWIGTRRFVRRTKSLVILLSVEVRNRQVYQHFFRIGAVEPRRF